MKNAELEEETAHEEESSDMFDLICKKVLV